VPELPEVEVTRLRIEPWLVGREIRAVRTSDASHLWLTPPAELRRRLRGRRALGLLRHGKYLIAELDDGARLLVHLGMTGQLFTEGAQSVRLLSATARALRRSGRPARFRPDRHTHLRIAFRDGGPRVLLRDVRRFGKVRWLGPGEREPRLERLGVDALAVSGERLLERTRGRKVAIKSLLLDQAVFAGIGNIYADEALFRAGVRPMRRARSALGWPRGFARCCFARSRRADPRSATSSRPTGATAPTRRSAGCTRAPASPARGAAPRSGASCSLSAARTTARPASDERRPRPDPCYDP
jgi:formamidopyrimidine-DNA glycosylase